jgi:hypothetical protein
MKIRVRKPNSRFFHRLKVFQGKNQHQEYHLIEMKILNIE